MTARLSPSIHEGRSFSGRETPTPASPVRTNEHRPWEVYGPNTDDVISRNGLPRPKTHKALHMVETNWPAGEWVIGLLDSISGCSQALAESLAAAMNADCQLQTAQDDKEI